MTQNLQPVIEAGLCIGCGACVAADPTLARGLMTRNGELVNAAVRESLGI